jgi:hypothetical protein
LLSILDQYKKYFKTPYFIFVRDTLSYLALLGLHFAVCLQPSTLRLTVSEWLILVFFLGRLLMEIDQVSSGMVWSGGGAAKPQQSIMKQLSNMMSKFFR